MNRRELARWARPEEVLLPRERHLAPQYLRLVEQCIEDWSLTPDDPSAAEIIAAVNAAVAFWACYVTTLDRSRDLAAIDAVENVLVRRRNRLLDADEHVRQHAILLRGVRAHKDALDALRNPSRSLERAGEKRRGQVVKLHG